jgi:S-DNA-T family DNA segregation ATPase FtsK/SpoIIIE
MSMRIPRSNFSIATSDRFAASADMREPVSPPHEVQSFEQVAAGSFTSETQYQPEEQVFAGTDFAEAEVPSPLSYAPAVVTEIVPASAAETVTSIPTYPLRSKQMSNNFAVKHWMDQDRAAPAEEPTVVAQTAAQQAAPVAAPQAVAAPVHPKPANPTMIMNSPHVAYQGLSVREQFGSDEKVWKNAFALAENVRFTRTPENELMRLRAKLIEEFGAEEETQPVAAHEQAAAPVVQTAQPVTTAASHPVRTAPVLRGPSSMIVAARLRLPVVPVAPHVEAVAPLAGAVSSPVVSVIPEAEVVNAVVSHLPQTPVVAEVTAASAVESEQSGLKLSHLSDFAFWEFAGLPDILPAATTPVVTVAEAVGVVAPVAAIAVEETVAAPVTETKSILSMFRAVELRPVQDVVQEKTEEVVTAEPVAVVEPQVSLSAEAPAEIAAPVAETVQVAENIVAEVAPVETAPAVAQVSNPFLPSFSFGLSGYQMPVYSIATQALHVPSSLSEVAAPVEQEQEQVVAAEATIETAPEAVVEQSEPIADVADVVAEQVEAPVEKAAVPVTFAAAPAAARNSSSSINLSIFSPTAIETGTVMSGEGYEYPPRALLQEPVYKDGAIISQEMLERSAGLLESILEDFGVRGEIIHVRPGPVVTLYEFEPAPGVKSSRVIGLADDIARSMSALSARVAVVPGRNVIGIELPNSIRETVYFRELIESPAFERTNCRLALCLGKTIGGEPVIAELAKMPHLLVAGTTGSGKSVAINTMILSLLYRLKPEECRLIMIDPKMLELSIYDGIPHLLTPVVTDPKKAVVALKWTVREMEERYRKMSRLGVRNIDGYNARAAAAREKGETVTCTVQAGFDKATGEILYEEQEMDLTPMPYIVVIVDEMADLMMVAGKEIEGAIQRLAQMARAAGIHLIMATQRPSVDVITGTIKANFPTRISFQVTSKIDSRTILGEQGAEQLLGQGDMLHMAGGGRIVRVHGPFVSDEEVEKVVNHLKEQGRPDYLATVTADEEETDAVEDDSAVFDKSDMGSEDGDDLYEKAVKVVLRDKKCSTSYIQRRLSIGYNRAASLVERMEQEGLVGAANHVGKREILGQNDGM